MIKDMISATNFRPYINRLHKVKSTKKIYQQDAFSKALVRSEHASILVALSRGSAVDIRVESYVGTSLNEVERLCEELSLIKGVNSVKVNGSRYVNPQPCNLDYSSYFIGWLLEAGIEHHDYTLKM